MKRTVTLILAVMVMLAGNFGPATANDHKQKDDTKVTAEMCKKDGWKELRDADGNPFKNQGQCVNYAKHGGEVKGIEPEEGDDVTAGALNATADAGDQNGDKIVPTATASATSESTATTASPAITIVDGQEPWNGYLEGSGFTPGASLTSVTFASDRKTLTLTSPVGTVVEQDGTFTTERIVYWCTEFDGHGETRGTVTVEDSSGASYSQEFDMQSHCEPEA